MDRPDQSGIVEPDIGEGGISVALEADRCPVGKTRDACEMPSRGNPAGSEQAGKGKLPVVAHHQVVAYVERRRSVGARRSTRIVKGRVAIERMSPSVAEQQRQVVSAPFR